MVAFVARILLGGNCIDVGVLVVEAYEAWQRSEAYEQGSINEIMKYFEC